MLGCACLGCAVLLCLVKLVIIHVYNNLLYILASFLSHSLVRVPGVLTDMLQSKNHSLGCGSSSMMGRGRRERRGRGWGWRG